MSVCTLSARSSSSTAVFRLPRLNPADGFWFQSRQALPLRRCSCMASSIPGNRHVGQRDVRRRSTARRQCSRKTGRSALPISGLPPSGPERAWPRLNAAASTGNFYSVCEQPHKTLFVPTTRGPSIVSRPMPKAPAARLGCQTAAFATTWARGARTALGGRPLRAMLRSTGKKAQKPNTARPQQPWRAARTRVRPLGLEKL